MIPVLPNPEAAEARDFVAAVAGKMPLWDADVLAEYERVQIGAVKADIARAQQTQETGEYLEIVSKLHDDWDALIALDELLKKESLT